MRGLSEMQEDGDMMRTYRIMMTLAVVVALGAIGAFFPSNVHAWTRTIGPASQSTVSVSAPLSMNAFEAKTEYCGAKTSCSARLGKAWNRAFLAQVGPSFPLDMACIHTYSSNGVRSVRFIQLLSYVFSSASYTRDGLVQVDIHARPDSTVEGSAKGAVTVRGKRIISGWVRIHLIGPIQHWHLEGSGDPSTQTWVADEQSVTTGSMDCNITPRSVRGVVHSIWQHFTTTTGCFTCSIGYKSDAIDF